MPNFALFPPFFLFLCFLCLFLIYSFERYIASCGWCKCFRPNTVGKHMTLSPTCWVRLKSVLDAAGSQNNNIIMYSNAPNKLDPADLLLDVVAQLTLLLETVFFIFTHGSFLFFSTRCRVRPLDVCSLISFIRSRLSFFMPCRFIPSTFPSFVCSEQPFNPSFVPCLKSIVFSI